jgi:myo-inositol-1(or 4)-monophosphatase
VTVSSVLDDDREILRRATTAAGALALQHFHAPPRHWYKGPGQVLTEADLAVDRLLKDMLLGARPDDAWLSEETPDDRARLDRRRVWAPSTARAPSPTVYRSSRSASRS